MKLELGLQESARAAVLGGFGATFISRIAIEGDLAAGTLAIVRVEGLEPARDVQLARRPAAPRRASRRRSSTFARERLDVIVRWGLGPLPEACAERGRLLAARRGEPALGLARAPVEPAAVVGGAVRSRSEAAELPGRDGVLAVGGGSAIDLGKAISAATGVAARLRPDDVRRRRVDDATSACATRSAACAAAAAARTRRRSSTSPA